MSERREDPTVEYHRDLPPGTVLGDVTGRFVRVDSMTGRDVVSTILRATDGRPDRRCKPLRGVLAKLGWTIIEDPYGKAESEASDGR